MLLLLAGLFLLASIICLFWLKDRLESPFLARIAYSEIVMRLAVIGAAIAVIGGLMILGDLFGTGSSTPLSR
jgi:hypothetical protein